MTAEAEIGPADMAILRAKAAIADDMAAELRLYRGYVAQFDQGYERNRMFAPLAAYDALVGQPKERSATDGT